MPPIQLKNAPSSAQTLTQDARAHVREAMRTTLASSSPPPLALPPANQIQTEARFGPKLEEFAAESTDSSRFLCCEEIDGRRWNYVVGMEGGSRNIRKGSSSVKAVSLQSPMTPADGWIMSESLLNPGRARLCELKDL